MGRASRLCKQTDGQQGRRRHVRWGCFLVYSNLWFSEHRRQAQNEKVSNRCNQLQEKLNVAITTLQQAVGGINSQVAEDLKKVRPTMWRPVYTCDFSYDFDAILRAKPAPTYPARVFGRVTLRQSTAILSRNWKEGCLQIICDNFLSSPRDASLKKHSYRVALGAVCMRNRIKNLMCKRLPWQRSGSKHKWPHIVEERLEELATFCECLYN